MDRIKNGFNETEEDDGIESEQLKEQDHFCSREYIGAIF